MKDIRHFARSGYVFPLMSVLQKQLSLVDLFYSALFTGDPPWFQVVSGRLQHGLNAEAYTNASFAMLLLLH